MQLTPELKNYIQSQRDNNISDEDIKKALLATGWDETTANVALTPGAMPPPPPPPQALPSQETEMSMWDSFQHILMFISMGVFVVAFTLLLHILIDNWIPKATTDTYGRGFYMGTFRSKQIRGYVSTVIVAYPLFTYLFLKLQRDTQLNPLIKKLKSRKILTYLTLIIAFLFIIGNVITTVFNFLDGNVSLNFIAHIVTTLFVSGFIFWFFLKQVKEDKS